MNFNKFIYTLLIFFLLSLNVFADDNNGNGNNNTSVSNNSNVLVEKKDILNKNNDDKLMEKIDVQEEIKKDRIKKEENLKIEDNDNKKVNNDKSNNSSITEKQQNKSIEKEEKKKIKYIAVPIEEYEQNNVKKNKKNNVKTQEQIDKEYQVWAEEEEKKPYFVTGAYIGVTNNYKNFYFNLGMLGDYVFNTGTTAFFIGFDFRWYVLIGDNSNIKDIVSGYNGSDRFMDRHLITPAVRIGHRFKIGNKHNYIAPYVIGGGTFAFSNPSNGNPGYYKGAGWNIGGGVDFVFSRFFLRLEYRYMNEVSKSFVGRFGGHTVGLSFGAVTLPIRHIYGYFCTECGRYYYINGYHCEHEDYRLFVAMQQYYYHPSVRVYHGYRHRNRTCFMGFCTTTYG